MTASNEWGLWDLLVPVHHLPYIWHLYSIQSHAIAHKICQSWHLSIQETKFFPEQVPTQTSHCTWKYWLWNDCLPKWAIFVMKQHVRQLKAIFQYSCYGMCQVWKTKHIHRVTGKSYFLRNPWVIASYAALNSVEKEINRWLYDIRFQTLTTPSQNPHFHLNKIASRATPHTIMAATA